MVNISNTFTLLCFGAWLGNATASTIDPISTASSKFDWSTFSVSSYPLGSDSKPTIAWSNQYSALASNSFTEYVYDWESELSKTAGTSDNWTQISVDQFSLSSYVSDSDLFRDNAPSSYTYRYGNFSVTGSGILIFSVDYSLFSYLVSGNDWSNFTSAGVSISVNKIHSNQIGQSFSAADAIYLSHEEEMLSPVQRTGTLNLALVVKDGDYFDFRARNEAYASMSSVPLPPSMWAFFLGFVTIFWRVSFTQSSSMRSSDTSAPN